MVGCEFLFKMVKMLSKYAVQNHEAIESKKGSDAFKALCHYWEVVNNAGYVPDKYDGDKYNLLNELNGLEMTKDEQLCVEMLKARITIEEMLKRVQTWSEHNNEGACTHEDMIKCGLGSWSKDMMLGQLWELYRGVING